MMNRQQIEYAKRRLRRWYTGPDLTGTDPLVAGKYYRITTYGTSDDFKNVGASCNGIGQIFKATGATPTTWANGSVLNEIKLETMKADADIVFESATNSPITITSSAFEGGSGSGELTFARDVLGQALEELIEEVDPNFVPSPRVAGVVLSFQPY
ncbi:MAG TPA: hypothetical protein VGM62_13880 [Chthoniobacterales bacterium]